MTVTKEQVTAAIKTLMAVAECIREVGSVPSGELYAQLMPAGITFSMYESIIQKLKDAKVVSESNHVLTWIGPKPKE